jgi:hypothetical protein
MFPPPPANNIGKILSATLALTLFDEDPEAN